MTAYTNQQLNTIYSYLGYNFYITFEAELSQAITATQAESDGGAQPDDTLQQQILTLIGNLQTVIDAQLLQLAYIDFVTESSKGSTINPARGDFLLRKQGRALITQLCIFLGIKGPRKDYYATSSAIPEEMGQMSYFPEDF
jgi:hypothetical protein